MLSRVAGRYNQIGGDFRQQSATFDNPVKHLVLKSISTIYHTFCYDDDYLVLFYY